MSLGPAAVAGHRAPSPGATNGNFASNNPFRRGVSPVQPPPTFDSSRPKMSNNPFLDPPAAPLAVQPQPATQNNPFGGEELFKDLTLLDKPATSHHPSRSLPRAGTMPPQNHRPSRSDEKNDARRLAPQPRGPPKPRGAANELDIFASPSQTENRRPRRASESSVMDKDKDKASEDDRRRRERRKEREARREKEGRSKDGSRSKSTKKPQGLDLIDKLDVTGIYGQGLFHHDGPFDACNPHRNRRKDHRAPMQAFPAGSANNVLGGSGPVNTKIDLDKFHGRGVEGFNDFAAYGGQDSNEPLARIRSNKRQEFNPKGGVEPIHSEESYGLGTSTFLEGAPASKSALQRRESETEASALQGGGLSRKKSLAVRLRGLSQPRRSNDPSGERVLSPDARYGPGSPGSPAEAVSAGGPARIRHPSSQEKNPFFNDYNDAYEKKGAQIRIAESANAGRPRAPSSPPPRPTGLGRSLTTDGAGASKDENTERTGNTGGGGFLNRMKSLKGGRRPQRPARRAS